MPNTPNDCGITCLLSNHQSVIQCQNLLSLIYCCSMHDHSLIRNIILHRSWFFSSWICLKLLHLVFQCLFKLTDVGSSSLCTDVLLYDAGDVSAPGSWEEETCGPTEGTGAVWWKRTARTDPSICPFCIL